jgi:multidrug efflux pump subunit AcrB/outer membrane protein TolC
MNPIRAALRYPQVVMIITAMLFVTGLTALFTMPRREDPKITIRTGLVTAIYPGATSSEVEAQVTHKLEERLFRFAEVRRAKTFSTTRNGVVIINVQLNESVQQADVFWARLRLDLTQMKSELPEGVQGPFVDSDFGDTVAVLIGIHAKNYDYTALKDDADKIDTALRALPAVSKIQRIGDQKEQIVVAESQQKLSQWGVNPQHVAQALESHSAAQYAGRVPTGTNTVEIDARGRFGSEDEIRNQLVDVTASGVPVALKDLATVSRVYEDPSQYVRINGEKAILLAVEMHEGNNIVSFGHALQKTLDTVQRSLPADVQLDLIANQPRVVSERIGDFFREFGIAIIAVILVTMLLLPMRVALVATVAIPVTVSLTFALLNLLGIELHQVSIAALIVVLGMVVDDAIVIADNYVELLDQGLARDDAAWRCASDMAVPVFTATVTIISSFAPLGMIRGSTGEFIRALPIGVSIALATSFVVAMILTPLTARAFIRKGLHSPAAETTARKKFSAIDALQRGYQRAITWAMQNRRTVLVSGVVAFVVGIGVLQLVKQQFFPLAERDQFVLDVWMPEGTRVEATDAVVRRIEQALQKESMVKNYSSFLGAGAPRFYYDINPQPPAENYAQVLVNTRSVAATPKLVEQLRAQLPALTPEARVFVKELQQGDDMEAPIEVRISGPDDTVLRSLAAQTENILRHTPGASYIHNDWHEMQLQTGVHLNDVVANRLGFTNANLAQQLAMGFEGVPVASYWEGDRALAITLRLAENERKSFDNVGDLYVQSPTSGASVPVRSIATLTPEWQSGRIVRRNGVRTITVRSFAEGETLPSQVLASARKQIAAMQLPEGYSIAYGGEEESQNETSGDMNWALVISLILIFLVLLLQFRTLSDPLIVMAAFPLALPGAALGLFITGNPFGFTAFVGVISLGGLVVRNSIILIDAIYDRIKAGTPLVQAATEAGERRLRPIFLTTMAAAVGVVPMIVSGSSLWSPLASVIAFGLLVSMFFTLIVIPVLFVAVHSRKAKTAPAVAAVLLALAALGSVPTQAQSPTVSLDEAIQLAQQKNRTVQMARLKVDEARAKVTEARADYFPSVKNESQSLYLSEKQSLTIPHGALGNYASTGDLPNKDISISLGRQNLFVSTTTAAQPLTQFFKIQAGVRAARADVATATADAQRAEDEVTLNVKKLYYNALAVEQRRKAAEARIHAGEQKIAEARNAVQSGTALEVEVQAAVAEIAEANSVLNTLEDSATDLKADLGDLLGLPANAEFSLSTTEVGTEEEAAAQNASGPALTAASLVKDALATNPEVASARGTLGKAQAGVRAARLEFVPDVSLFAQHMYQNGVPLLADNSATVGLRMEWTLSEFGKRTGQIRERKAQQAQAELNLQQTENHLQIEVEKVLRRLRRSAVTLRAAEAAEKARAEMRRLVSDQVEAKTATGSALAEAEAKLAEARAQLFEVHVERATARAELARLLGQRLY